MSIELQGQGAKNGIGEGNDQGEVRGKAGLEESESREALRSASSSEVSSHTERHQDDPAPYLSNKSCASEIALSERH